MKSKSTQQKPGETTLPNLASEEPRVTEAMPQRSRLQHKVENNSKKTLLFSLLGIVLLITLLVTFGVPLLETVATMTSKSDATDKESADETIVLLPPDLTADFEATNSAEIRLSGSAEDGTSVKLYNGGTLAEETKVKEDGTFTFMSVSLKEGRNIFKAKVTSDSHESKFSDPLTITYRKEAPKLTIDYPSEGQGISNKDGDRLQIEGSTDPDVTVTINGSQTIVDDKGSFKQFIPIRSGENTIKAIANDDAGNKTEVERKFTYNP